MGIFNESQTESGLVRGDQESIKIKNIASDGVSQSKACMRMNEKYRSGLAAAHEERKQSEQSLSALVLAAALSGHKGAGHTDHVLPVEALFLLGLSAALVAALVAAATTGRLLAEHISHGGQQIGLLATLAATGSGQEAADQIGRSCASVLGAGQGTGQTLQEAQASLAAALLARQRVLQQLPGSVEERVGRLVAAGRRHRAQHR